MPNDSNKRVPLSPHKNKPAINPTWNDVVQTDPLVKFSWYFSGRATAVVSLGEDILAALDAGFSSSHVDGGKIQRAENLMWFWTLGAYEVVRTMSQASKCFSTRICRELKDLKGELSKIRMPAAKMEKPGRKEPIPSSRSPSGWDASDKDLLVNDPTDLETVSARVIIERFASVMRSIEPGDVIGMHESSY